MKSQVYDYPIVSARHVRLGDRPPNQDVNWVFKLAIGDGWSITVYVWVTYGLKRMLNKKTDQWGFEHRFRGIIYFSDGSFEPCTGSYGIGSPRRHVQALRLFVPPEPGPPQTGTGLSDADRRRELRDEAFYALHGTGRG